MPQTDTQSIRQRILSEAIVDPGIAATLLLETENPAENALGVSAASPNARRPLQNLTLSTDCLLIRWLRTNHAYLPIPDRIGVWDELPEVERQTLQSLGISGCLPLIMFDELIGCLGFITSQDAGRPVQWASRLALRAPHWATELRRVQQAASQEIHSEAIARSNRLNLTGQLAASVAHEVRNPLAAIRSTVQTIRDDDIASDSRKQLLTRILDDVDRVNRVVSDMLTLGKPRISRYEYCDLTGVIQDARDFCSTYAKRSGLQIDIEPSEPLIVNADPAELRQVLVNLLLNACQASKPGDHVRIGLQSAPHSAHIAVTDTGAGMLPQDCQRAFDPFFSTKVDGGGLGLPICLDIVRRHGGDLMLTSQLGHGTTATVILPT